MHPGNILFNLPGGDVMQPEIVVLDAGLAVKLKPQDRKNFVEVFHAIAMSNGRRVGELMLDRTPGDKTKIVDPVGFVAGVEELVCSVRAHGLALGKVRIGSILGKMLKLACDHRVKLET